jgi:hypothetical protein
MVTIKGEAYDYDVVGYDRESSKILEFILNHDELGVAIYPLPSVIMRYIYRHNVPIFLPPDWNDSDLEEIMTFFHIKKWGDDL